MASNNELIEQILELDADANTDGLNNKKLAELLAEIKARPATDEAEAAAAEAEAPAEPDVEDQLPEYTVAKGKSLTTLRGVIDGGAAICAKDLAGGEKTLKSLCSKGYVKHNA